MKNLLFRTYEPSDYRTFGLVTREQSPFAVPVPHSHCQWFTVTPNYGGLPAFQFSLPIVPNSGGDLWWLAVICGRLWSFSVVCDGLSYSHTGVQAQAPGQARAKSDAKWAMIRENTVNNSLPLPCSNWNLHHYDPTFV